ncbi:hypothetical protein HDV06_000749 [Boothiomyces sp. JEL0866]|nr:hypothetical protein HDV06_000749 [Boothiomyces sp. JEL0866]
MASNRILALQYSPECSTYYGAHIPKHSTLSQTDFDLILFELNKNKLSGLASIPAVNWHIFSAPFIGLSIYGWQRIDLFIVLSFLFYVSVTASRKKYQESIIITCSRLTTVLASKGISVGFNRDTKQVVVSSVPEWIEKESSDSFVSNEWAQVPKEEDNSK